jgi:hypothetical protein
MNKSIFLVSILCLTFSKFASAETALSYPELDVVPRATERLNMMIEKEKSNRLLSNLPMQISAISTLATGLMQLNNVDTFKDPANKSPAAGIIVGTAWLGINYLVGSRYHVYESSAAEINKISGKTNRDQLMRERLAEEGINNAAQLASRLKWLSVASNFGANAFMLGKVKKDTGAQVMGAFSLLASFSPVLFTSDWEKVATDQNSYKKKVYGPIFTSSLFQTSEGRFTPGLLMAYSFE